MTRGLSELAVPGVGVLWEGAIVLWETPSVACAFFPRWEPSFLSFFPFCTPFGFILHLVFPFFCSVFSLRFCFVLA